MYVLVFFLALLIKGLALYNIFVLVVDQFCDDKYLSVKFLDQLLYLIPYHHIHLLLIVFYVFLC